MDFTKDKAYEKVLNKKPKLYDEIIEGLRKPEHQKPELPIKPAEPATIKIRPISKKYRDEIYDAGYDYTDKKVYMVYEYGKRESLNSFAKKLFRYPINVWENWEYLDHETNSWRLIDELRKEKRPVREVQGEIETSGVSKAQIEPPSSKPEEIVIGSTDYPKQYGVIGLSEDGRKTLLDLNAPHIIFVSGMQGAGKGYTIGVISEMLVGKGISNISHVSKTATVIVLYKPKDDVPSEFWSIRQPNDIQKELDNLYPLNAKPMSPITEDQFRVFLDPGVYVKYRDKFKFDYNTQNVHPLYIDPSTLSGEDWANALATGESSEALYVKKIFKILRNLPADFDMEDITNEINASDLNETQKGLAKARLEILEEYLKKDDLINNLVIGGVNIVDFRKAMYQPDDIFTIMTLIMSKLQNKKELENEPFVFIINEAHLYFKKGISKDFLENIDNLIRRKRHGANWLLLDTHLPTDVDSKVIELSDIKILHFTDKTVDSLVLKKILGEDDRLFKLHTGEAIVCANQSSLGLSISILVRIRPRVSKHGSATKTAIESL